MLQKILTSSFYLLFFLTPLSFISLNHELFEYNKMMLVYFLTIVITGTWLLKMLQYRSLIIKTTPLSIPIGLFLAANFISTVLSIDVHTSIWGYYTRSNGGLLSIIAYTLLFLALVSNFGKEQVLRFLKVAILSGLVVSLYAIPEHFGVSPSCLFLYGQFSANCWVQDVQARVFATLGQPNWLGAYLAMLIFPAWYFLITSAGKIKYYYGAVLVLMYMALTFTYSRGAIFGLMAGFGVLGLSLGVIYMRSDGKNEVKGLVKPLAGIVVAFLVINLLFGSALTRFKLVNQAPEAAKKGTGGVTQLENGGTESGRIRLIVWKGALAIFKHYPLFGSGVETFAYSYYQFRPPEHNLVSEWDFLYNKAHNEYLNYLATTGMVGFGAYLLLIGTFVVWSTKRLMPRGESPESSENSLDSRLLILAILSSYISYLVQNIFGFSVVIIAVFFYLFPGMAFVYTDSTKEMTRLTILKVFDLKRGFGKVGGVVGTAVVMILTISGLLMVARNWVADTLYAKGSNYSDAGNSGQAYNYLGDAVFLNSGEPLYRSDLGYAAASAAVALVDTDATLSARLKNEAVAQTNYVLSKNPNNTSYLRTAIRTYYELASLDPVFNQKTLEAFDLAIKHAPTDPKLYYNKGLVLNQLQMVIESIATLKQAIDLKPNYREVHLTLAIIYSQTGQKQLAIDELNTVLKLVPNDPEALAKLKEIEGK